MAESQEQRAKVGGDPCRALLFHRVPFALCSLLVYAMQRAFVRYGSRPESILCPFPLHVKNVDAYHDGVVSSRTDD